MYKEGHKVSKETKLKLSIANKGQKRSETTKRNISKGRTGLKDSIQTRKKKSIAVKISWEKRRKSYVE